MTSGTPCKMEEGRITGSSHWTSSPPVKLRSRSDLQSETKEKNWPVGGSHSYPGSPVEKRDRQVKEVESSGIVKMQTASREAGDCNFLSTTYKVSLFILTLLAIAGIITFILEKDHLSIYGFTATLIATSVIVCSILFCCWAIFKSNKTNK